MTEPQRPPRTPLLRRQLAVRLIELRKRARLTQDEVSATTGLARPSISKIENAEVRVRVSTLRQLLGAYGVTGPELDMLTDMARQSIRQGPGPDYAAVAPDFALNFLELESYAREIWAFTSGHIPGLLQTPDYVRRITRARHPARTDDDLTRSAQLRERRQQRVFGEDPPRTHFVIDEAALLRGVTAAQLDHLIMAASWEATTLQVLPLATGPHAAQGSAFDLLRLSDADHGMEYVYQDNLLGAVYYERPDEVRECVDVFRQVAQQAMTPEETVPLLVELRDALGHR